jgi:hypothetical protein
VTHTCIVDLLAPFSTGGRSPTVSLTVIDRAYLQLRPLRQHHKPLPLGFQIEPDNMQRVHYLKKHAKSKVRT